MEPSEDTTPLPPKEVCDQPQRHSLSPVPGTSGTQREFPQDRQLDCLSSDNEDISSDEEEVSVYNSGCLSDNTDDSSSENDVTVVKISGRNKKSKTHKSNKRKRVPEIDLVPESNFTLASDGQMPTENVVLPQDIDPEDCFEPIKDVEPEASRKKLMAF